MKNPNTDNRAALLFLLLTLKGARSRLCLPGDRSRLQI
jgi:hypothetical protein